MMKFTAFAAYIAFSVLSAVIFIACLLGLRAELAAYIMLSSLSLITIATAVVFKIRVQKYGYLYSGDKLTVCDGIIFKSERTVSFGRVRQTEFRQNPISAEYNTGKLLLTTAGGRVVIKFIDSVRAKKVINAVMSKDEKI